MNVLTYESHVTVEPVFGLRLDAMTVIAKAHGFKVADLLFQKRETDTPTRNKNDTFCTGHGKTFEDLQTRMIHLCKELRANEYAVHRYKIEAVQLDTKFQGDTLNLLK